MSWLRRLVTAAFADASGVRRSWLTAASSAVRIRSAAASGRAVAASSASRSWRSATAAWAANASTIRRSAASSRRPLSTTVIRSSTGTAVSPPSGVQAGRSPTLATTHQACSSRARSGRPLASSASSSTLTARSPKVSRS